MTDTKLTHPYLFSLMIFCMMVWVVCISYAVGFPGKHMLIVGPTAGLFGMMAFILCITTYPFTKLITANE